jgi:ubiquinone biosynthesis protein
MSTAAAIVWRSRSSPWALYITGSLLLMEHSLGPRLGDLPAFAVFAYALALWFTFRLARAIARSGRL